ncbi:hypothetical protein [Slackia exigua]
MTGASPATGAMAGISPATGSSKMKVVALSVNMEPIMSMSATMETTKNAVVEPWARSATISPDAMPKWMASLPVATTSSVE